MNKVRFYILLYSILIVLTGAAFISFAIEFVWMLIIGGNYIPVGRLKFNFIVGLIVGLTVILLHMLVMKIKKKPMMGYIISSVGILAIIFGVYLYTGLTLDIWDVDLKWLVCFIVPEGFVIPFTVLWNKKMRLYNSKLESKKASLKEFDN